MFPSLNLRWSDQMAGRCLVIGAAGQLGQALSAVLRSDYDVVEAVHRNPQPGQLVIDLEDAPRTIRTVADVRPEWILIAGAFCNVDRAETEREICFQVNADTPRVIAEYAQQLGTGVVFYSSDYIFDGTQERYWETDVPTPLNVYAQSKVQGEVAIRELLPAQHLILRTTWVYGPDDVRRNFVLRLISDVSTGNHVRVPLDQWGSPTYAEDLARATHALLQQGANGTFHVAGPECVDRYTLAQRICRCFGLNESLVQGVPTAQLGQLARRPLKVYLDCGRFQALGCASFRGIDAGLEALKAWYLSVVS